MSCDVHVIEAPVSVRIEIERQILDEPKCARTLDVRVVETADGLVVTATDPQGVARSRTVPDAASAAILVVSWSADATLSIPRRTPVLDHPVTYTVDNGQALRTIGGIAIFVGMGLVAGGIYEGVRANNAIAKIENGQPWPDDIAEQEAAGRRAETLEHVFLVSGGALLATGIITYAIGRSWSEEIVVVPQARGVGIMTRF